MSKDKPRRKHKTEKPPLSAREIRFAQLVFEYGVHGKSKAYLEAGYSEHASKNATEVAACAILRKPQFRDYLRELQTAASDAAKATVEEIVQGIRCIAKADRRQLFGKRGNLLPPEDIPDDVAATIESIDNEEIYEPVPGEKGKKRLKGHMRKIKTGNRLAAWRTLAEIRGILGQDKTAATTGKKEEPFRVGGEANPDALTAP